MKIIIKETRTLPVPQEMVDKITDIYRSAYIKLVVDFVEKQLADDSQSRLFPKYNKLLEEINKIYSKEISNIGKVGFTSDLDVGNVIENGELIESIPVEQFIKALVAWPGLDTYLGDKIKPKQFKTRLNRYFQNKGTTDIQFNIEFGTRGTTKKKDYAGLYESDIDAVTVVFNSSFFVPVDTGEQDRLGNPITIPAGLNVSSRKISSILENIDVELEDTRTSVRHEIQHLFQNTMSSVLGSGQWEFGVPPRDVLSGTSSGDEELPHHMQPIEMQTDIQDEVDKFLSYVDKFKQSNADKSAMFPKAIKILIKLFADSKLTDEEKMFAKTNKLNSYVMPSELLRTIKSSSGGQELYKYALKILYTSVSEQLQENVIMNKIKIVLKENKVLSESLTKEEIRKLVRDELEKLLNNKEIKKEIGEISKNLLKKLYRELSVNSTYVVDRIDI
jgi:hypothetical protein